jgi:hypothetical protein
MLHPSSGNLNYKEDGGSTFLQNIGKLLPDYMASHPIKIEIFMATGMRTSNLT